MQLLRKSIAATLLTMAVFVPQWSNAQQDRDSLVGTISESPDTRSNVGAQVTFVGLLGQTPVMVWTDGYETKLSKIFQSPDLLIMQSIGALGSMDTVFIEAKNKRFLVVSAGAVGVPAGQPVRLVQYRGSLR